MIGSTVHMTSLEEQTQFSSQLLNKQVCFNYLGSVSKSFNAACLLAEGVL